jgi:hypothetical protein
MTKFAKGQSGNPQGRPVGSSLSGKLQRAIEKDFDGIVSALVGQALAGDTQAASLLLSPACPALKPTQQPVAVNLDGETLTDKAGAVLDAVGRAMLSPGDAKQLLDGLAAVSKIVETDELTRRIEVLERTAKK